MQEHLDAPHVDKAAAVKRKGGDLNLKRCSFFVVDKQEPALVESGKIEAFEFKSAELIMA